MQFTRSDSITFVTQPNLIKVYHVTDSRNTDRILAEGLQRPPRAPAPKSQSVAVVDCLFDYTAWKNGGTRRRTGELYAFPDLRKIIASLPEMDKQYGPTAVFEIDADPQKAIVMQQECVNVFIAFCVHHLEEMEQNYLTELSESRWKS